MKRESVVALALLLLIPAVLMLGGFLFALINPEIGAGHANYVLTFHLLTRLRVAVLFGSFLLALALWILVCFLVIRSKQRSQWWLLLAALGPLGLAILATLDDPLLPAPDRHSRFVRGLNKLQRVAYEVCKWLAIWELAYQAMVVKRNLMILYESATTGTSTAQIIATQNASSGMWAFGEGLEVMFLVVLFYLLWPIVFNLVARIANLKASPR
jgi:hypothetical protein